MPSLPSFKSYLASAGIRFYAAIGVPQLIDTTLLVCSGLPGMPKP